MRFNYAVAFACLLLVGCTTDSTLPETPIQLDPALMQRAVRVHVDLNEGTTRVVEAEAPRGTSASLVGNDVVTVTAGAPTRTSAGGGRDVVRFDVAVTNRLEGIVLKTPTMPAPPAGVTGVLLFPYAATVTAGRGSVEPSADWDGEPHNFFNDPACRGGDNDCFRYEAFPGEIEYGQTTAARTVGFTVGRDVSSFDVYFVVAADLFKPQVGSLQGRVMWARGGLSARVTLTPGGRDAITDGAGSYSFANLRVGTYSATLSDLPAGCTAPPAQNAVITAGGTTMLDFFVECPLPNGVLQGVVRTNDPTPIPLAGYTVTTGTSIAVTSATGTYEFANLPSGPYTVTVLTDNKPCQTESRSVQIDPAYVTSLNFSLTCPRPGANAGADQDVTSGASFTLDGGASSAYNNAPLTYTWELVGGSVVGNTAIVTTTAPATLGKNLYRLTVSDGVHTGSDDVSIYSLENGSAAIFVSTSGSDANPGTRAQPMRTIESGIASAAAINGDVYVSQGTFSSTSTIALVAGTSIYGGFESDWSRAGAHTVVSVSARIALQGNGANNVTLDYLSVQGGNATTAQSAYGIKLIASSNVVISNSIVTAGRGGPGAAGSFGAMGTGGGGGGNADNGSADSNVPAGGGGGGTTNGVQTGGRGGRGIYRLAGENGAAGDLGAMGGAGGAAGNVGQPGSDGAGGQPGANGTNGAAAPVAVQFISNEFVTENGGNGTSGTNGHGGGGGGGGGGQTCLLCVDGTGNGGGGGGGGGTGGTGGGGGSGGGASIAIAVFASTVTVSNTQVITTGGGTGGAGGSGGSGGLGGPGGQGATAYTSEVGAGGNGGRGGNGGSGGSGAGGNGGPSIGLLQVDGGTITQTAIVFTLGAGGSGGSSLIPGSNGQMYNTLTR